MTILKHEVVNEEAIVILKPSGSTILKVLDKNGYANKVHRACQQGYCGSCRTQLLEGQVEYIDEPLAFIDEGEILPCHCVALTEITLKL